jgi:hypothetical protein
MPAWVSNTYRLPLGGQSAIAPDCPKYACPADTPRTPAKQKLTIYHRRAKQKHNVISMASYAHRRERQAARFRRRKCQPSKLEPCPGTHEWPAGSAGDTGRNSLTAMMCPSAPRAITLQQDPGRMTGPAQPGGRSNGNPPR